MLLSLASPDATRLLGLALGKLARAGDIITLEGDLGAGKTTLTQAIGAGLGVPPEQYITSPTFAIMHQYPGRLPLYHMDLYRIGDEDFYALGLDEYLYADGLCVIEWPHRLEDLPSDRLAIELCFAGDITEARTARLTPLGAWRDRDLAPLFKTAAGSGNKPGPGDGGG